MQCVRHPMHFIRNFINLPIWWNEFSFNTNTLGLQIACDCWSFVSGRISIFGDDDWLVSDKVTYSFLLYLFTLFEITDMIRNIKVSGFHQFFFQRAHFSVSKAILSNAEVYTEQRSRFRWMKLKPTAIQSFFLIRQVISLELHFTEFIW